MARDRILADLSTPPMPGSGVAAIFGKRGHGKTSVSRERYFTWDRAIVLDSQVKDGRGEYPGWPAGSMEELRDLLRRFAKEGRARWRIAYRGPLHFEPLSRRVDPVLDAEPLFSFLSGIENYLLVVEEADKVCDSKRSPPSLYRMVHHGRRFGQAVTICSRRPQNVAKDLISQADLVIAFPMHDPADKDALRARGFDVEALARIDGHASLRLLAPEGERPAFYLCQCREPHSEVCGNPLPEKGTP